MNIIVDGFGGDKPEKALKIGTYELKVTEFNRESFIDVDRANIEIKEMALFRDGEQVDDIPAGFKFTLKTNDGSGEVETK